MNLANIGAAWQAASGRQKITVVVALLVALGGVSQILSPTGTTQSASGSSASPTPLALATETVAVTASAVPAARTPAASPPASSTPVPTPPRTAVPTPMPTLAPTPTPRPTTKLTPQPTPAPKPALTLTFTSLTSPVSPGGYATATVKTLPGASCSVVVEYKSGPSKAAGLDPTTANASGVASWTWKVGTRTTPGSWPVTVTCRANGSAKSVTKYLKVS